MGNCQVFFSFIIAIFLLNRNCSFIFQYISRIIRILNLYEQTLIILLNLISSDENGHCQNIQPPKEICQHDFSSCVIQGSSMSIQCKTSTFLSRGLQLNNENYIYHHMYMQQSHRGKNDIIKQNQPIVLSTSTRYVLEDFFSYFVVRCQKQSGTKVHRLAQLRNREYFFPIRLLYSSILQFRYTFFVKSQHS